MFGNNIEKLGYYDSPWAKVEVSADGSTIYKGRPSNPHANDDDPVWMIVLINVFYDENGNQMIETRRTTDSKNKWSDRKTRLNYQLI